MKFWTICAITVAASVALGGLPAPAPIKPDNPPATPPPQPTKPEEKPAPATQPPTATPPPPTPTQPSTPSLDEMLGLAKPKDKPATPPPDAKPAIPGALDRALKGEEEGNELQRAVTLMSESAKRLESGKDTSIETQRVQEETVRLLDALVKKGNQKKNPQNKPQNQQQKQDQQQQQPNQSQQSQTDQTQPGQETSPSVERGGTTNSLLRPGIDAARAAWGNLPQRVRQLLMQGSGDQFSKEYQRLTEEYYKRLGESGGN